jgi:Fur family ferric uptake transcriptional regulator
MMAYCKNWQEGLMSHHRIAYEDIMRAAGHRVTRQRILILDAVCDEGSHTTLGRIYARVRAADSTIDRSTLYRTLKLFNRLGLVVSAQPGDGEIYYEIAHHQHHHHLVCRRCGAEAEIPHTILETVIKQVEAQYGFLVQTEHLVLTGLCQQCAAGD